MSTKRTKKNGSRTEIKNYLGALASNESLDCFASVGEYKSRKVLGNGDVVSFHFVSRGNRARPKKAATL